MNRDLFLSSGDEEVQDSSVASDTSSLDASPMVEGEDQGWEGKTRGIKFVLLSELFTIDPLMRQSP